MKKDTPTISIVLGSYNRKLFLKDAIQSIRQNNILVEYEIIVIDGGSNDGSIEFLVSQEDIITIVQHNRDSNGFSSKRSWGYFMNIAFKATHGKYIVMLSDDCLILKNSIMNAYNFFENHLKKGDKIGAVAFYFRNYPIDSNYYVISTYNFKLFVNHGMYLREALEVVNFIEEDLYNFYYADGDICCKLWQKGYSVLDCPKAIVEHFFQANPKIRDSNNINKLKNLEDFRERWKNIYYDSVINNFRSKKYISFIDSNKIARTFHKHLIYYYYGILKYHFRSFFNKPQNTIVKIVIVFNQKLVLFKNKKDEIFSLPHVFIDNKNFSDSVLKIKDFCQQDIKVNDIKKIDLVYQLGLKPEPETYFYKVDASINESSLCSDYLLVNIKKINKIKLDNKEKNIISLLT